MDPERLRAKLHRARRLSLDWVRRGGDQYDVVETLTLCHWLLDHEQVRAGERVLDGLLVRLQEDPFVTECASAA